MTRAEVEKERNLRRILSSLTPSHPIVSFFSFSCSSRAPPRLLLLWLSLPSQSDFWHFPVLAMTCPGSRAGAVGGEDPRQRWLQDIMPGEVGEHKHLQPTGTYLGT